MDPSTHIALSAPLYMAVTQEVMFIIPDAVLDPSGKITVDYATITDGPFTTPEKAAAALNKRADNNRFMWVTSALTPYSYGLYADHGGTSSWARETKFTHPSGEVTDSWQKIEVVRLDEGEHC